MLRSMIAVPMGKEIERKFLVDITKLPENLDWQPLRQGYLAFEPCQVRVRISRGVGTLTIKSAGTMVRDEWEYVIPPANAEKLLTFCGSYIIDKDRVYIELNRKTWSVDRYHNQHEGLVTAEIELDREDEEVKLPPWIAREVTGDERYLNMNLARS